MTPDDLPYGRAARAAAALFLFVALLALFANLTHPRQMDFISFWAAAKLALQGNAPLAWDTAAHQAVQDGVGRFGGFMTFVYPPPFLIALLPFGVLPYGVAAIAWVAAGFALYRAACARALPALRWQAAAFPPVLINAVIGQAGLFFAALMIGAGRLLDRHPVRAGLLFGMLVVKPQIAPMLGVALLAGRRWRTIGAAMLSAVLLLLAGLLLFGWESYAAMGRLMPSYGAMAFDSPLGHRKMVSVYAALRLAGMAAQLAMVAHLAVAAAVAGMVWAVWRRDYTPEAKMAVVVAATCIASPYLLPYDLAMLILPLGWLAGRVDARLLALIWCWPLLSLAQSLGFYGGPNLMPLMPLAILLLMARALSRSGSA